MRKLTLACLLVSVSFLSNAQNQSATSSGGSWQDLAKSIAPIICHQRALIKEPKTSARDLQIDKLMRQANGIQANLREKYPAVTNAQAQEVIRMEMERLGCFNTTMPPDMQADAQKTAELMCRKQALDRKYYDAIAKKLPTTSIQQQRDALDKEYAPLDKKISTKYTDDLEKPFQDAVEKEVAKRGCKMN